ncbi:activating signal cointegrator 1 complex subunit 3-like [Lytechinus variegatus]|uniref:activating signal cointegrator 1 complex subunit 3-like n=1 Tax=Lytechinus variegatus TaxID=7654 RepID=UPI001BB1E785|nr:activating signal cointegrator 1 complex subunit 3-like [Lytechinus variegatus]XP_041463236.1 activating signal cointegrator 1 complex subunit 3-like [Lytechinus variegatus]
MKSLPRLTKAVRVFASVTAGDETPDGGEISLAQKRIYQSRRKTKQGLTWIEFGEAIINHTSASRSEVTGTLRNIIHLARSVAGADASPEEVSATAVCFCEVLHESESLGQLEIQAVRSKIGPCQRDILVKIQREVQTLVSHVPGDVLSSLFNPVSSDTDEKAKEFGHSYAFSFDERAIDTDNFLSTEPETSPASPALNLQFNLNNAAVSRAASEPTPKDGGATKATQPNAQMEWLEKEVKKSVGSGGHNAMGLTVDALCSKLLVELTSGKSNDELQTDLFDLLGFDCFELIQQLLAKRTDIVAAATQASMARIAAESRRERLSNQKPSYATQVTVQSEREKELEKALRKEEKKLLKKEAKASAGGEEGAGNEQILDPQYLKAQREKALKNAKRTPLFTSTLGLERTTGAPKEIFPNVYDSLATAQMSSSFIAGAKMMLPIGFQKSATKLYEEVIIPPADRAPVSVGKNLVPISQLDEIGRVAFKGMKSLNRIQSVVFETAYNTNENLLICAPTGAGKTNIAMLTILQEVRKHIQQGVIKKDEFKIVYVAPMKALAAEMVRNFGTRLAPLGLSVKELTGDMQLTKNEIMKTQMLVTTPEKWDVVTRKSTGDVALTQLVKLLIIDEVHLLHDDRGAVIESLVARTLRQVESSQSMIRIVGLSATLPNYVDVARFLNVNPYIGLFFFDTRFRPVPLGQTFIGIKTPNIMQQRRDMDFVCYEKVRELVDRGHQVMVFVHARNATVQTAMYLRETAKGNGEIGMFQGQQSPEYGSALKQVMKSRNKQLRELFPDGFSIHHAGMLRQDRNLVERYFAAGHLKVLVCTATLAWGVNLPAHAVVIKGTQLYDANKGAFKDLGILDVLQIFGRAGRPQYDSFGEGFIITTHEKLNHYLSLITRQNAIESQFISSLADNLNAEIALGTVSNVDEAVRWLSYTYLYVRMHLNPMAYGLMYKDTQSDPGLAKFRNDLIITAARSLDKAKMIRFVEHTGDLHSTDLGRVASHFYIKHATIEKFNEMMKSVMSEAEVFSMVSQAQEFEQIKVREDEMRELQDHLEDDCEMPAAGGVENAHGKVNILLQTFISRGNVDSFSLVSDSAYVAQNAARIIRALFEITLRTGWPLMAANLLMLSKSIDRRLWAWENPLRQFSVLSYEILRKLEAKKLSVDKLREMDSKEIGLMVHHVSMGPKIKGCAHQLPAIKLDASIQPITRTVLRVRLTITPDFTWNDRVHGTGSESWWIWVEDPENNHIYHSEYFLLQKKQVVSGEDQSLVFTIPIFEPLPSQYYVKAVSDRWLGSETICPISFQHLILPERHPPHTELLDLVPLPKTALKNAQYQMLQKFDYFNPIQTQIFHTLYHTDHNVLLGAPTGSGKTVAAEIAMFRVFNEQPKTKVVYIAPLKALVRERIQDWKVRLEEKLGKRVVELTGDVTPDVNAIARADVIVTTPEKWDGVSRSWQNRNYVKAVSLLVIDEIHLLGDERGPVLEVIVSRTNFISHHTERKVRVIGLSTALANARDLADWLGIKEVGLFNFRPSVRPVPLEVHISGFPGKHYCPRMATMNKPTFQAIKVHSPTKPALIFVSSRRQTRLTALDLISYLAGDDNPKQWMHMEERQMDHIIESVKDSNLRLTLSFGIGMHHAGLHERDRKTVEELFCNQRIQVLIATSTLAWGVNFPAHLVVIKGTEYFDGKTKRYADFPITDVLQMMGRAGRPQYDDKGTAVILVHDIKKHFYKKFLYEPFPVESNLLEVLPEHLNAEIVAGTVTTKQDAMDYITWTYFFRRLVMNPSYYELEDTSHEGINKFLSGLVEKSLLDLAYSYCIEIGDDNRSLEPQTLGRISSYYYLHHRTVRMFQDSLGSECSLPDLLTILSDAHEYEDLPVRHNEDSLNSNLAEGLPLEVNRHSFDSPHTKTHLLLQAHMSRAQLPCSDYFTDTKSVLDQAIRVLQAMIDVVSFNGWLVTALQTMHLVQCIIQARWFDDSPLLTLPHVEQSHLQLFRTRAGLVEGLPELMDTCSNKQSLRSMLKNKFNDRQIDEIWTTVQKLPVIEVGLSMNGWWVDGGQQESKHLPTTYIHGRARDSDFIQCHADQQYVLQVELRRLNRGKESKAHSPRFPKPKDEGWWLVLGDVDNKDLLAMKRLGFVRGRSVVQLSFYTPERLGRVIYSLYLMSDCYIGIDQQYSVCLDVIEANIETQLNTEINPDELDSDLELELEAELDGLDLDQ